VQFNLVTKYNHLGDGLFNLVAFDFT